MRGQFSFYCHHRIFFFFHQNFFYAMKLHFSPSILVPVHEEVIAFYYVRAADIFDTVTITCHHPGRLLTSLFTTLTRYIILPNTGLSRPATAPRHSDRIWETPWCFPSRQQKPPLCSERLLRHNGALTAQKLAHLTPNKLTKTLQSKRVLSILLCFLTEQKCIIFKKGVVHGRNVDSINSDTFCGNRGSIVVVFAKALLEVIGAVVIISVKPWTTHYI